MDIQRNKAQYKKYRKVGPYILSEEIGRGAFSIVYSAKKEGEKNRYAVKQIMLTNLKPKQLQRIHCQINVLTTIKHKNIVNLVDYKQTSRNLYLVFEYCKNTDLQIYVNKYCDGKMPEQKVKKIGIQIKNAFEVLRQHKIVHRDLKKANILVTEDFEIKIADFGFAKHLDDNQFFGSYVGSPITMAPQIMEDNRTYNQKCDLWSLGIILYELLFGKNPFFTQLKMTKAQVKNATKSVLKIPNQISPQAQDLLRKLIVRCPNNRISFQQFFKHPWLSQHNSINNLNQDLLQQTLRNQLKNTLSTSIRKKEQKQFLLNSCEDLLSYEIIQNVKNSIQGKFMFWINLGKKIMNLQYENSRMGFLAIGVLLLNLDHYQNCVFVLNANQDRKIMLPKYQELRKLQKWQMSEYTKRLPDFISRSRQKMQTFLKQQKQKLKQFNKQELNTSLPQLFLFQLTSQIALHIQRKYSGTEIQHEHEQAIQTFLKIHPITSAPHVNLQISSALFSQTTIDLLLKKIKLKIPNNSMYKRCVGVFKLQTQYREEPEDNIYQHLKNAME